MSKLNSLLVAEIIPVAVILLYMIFPIETLYFAYSFLGKIAALMIIMFYTSMDKTVGVFVALLYIFLLGAGGEPV